MKPRVRPRHPLREHECVSRRSRAGGRVPPSSGRGTGIKRAGGAPLRLDAAPAAMGVGPCRSGHAVSRCLATTTSCSSLGRWRRRQFPLPTYIHAWSSTNSYRGSSGSQARFRDGTTACSWRSTTSTARARGLRPSTHVRSRRWGCKGPCASNGRTGRPGVGVRRGQEGLVAESGAVLRRGESWKGSPNTMGPQLDNASSSSRSGRPRRTTPRRPFALLD